MFKLISDRKITHRKRWITGLAALPLLVLLIISGGYWFAGALAAVGMICLWEYFRMVLDSPEESMLAGIPLIGFTLGFLMILSAHRFSSEFIMVILAVNVMASGCVSLFLFSSSPSALKVLRKQVQGTLYIPFFLSFLVMIRKEPDGVAWIFFLLSVIFAGDIGAFYVGSLFGKHKLCPAVSPGKTIEGALGGLVSNVIAGCLFQLIFFPGYSWGHGMLFMVSAGGAGQVGDLFESQLKRVSGVKDSGWLLPGHGGFLDRIDALLFAAPVAFFFKTFVFA